MKCVLNINNIIGRSKNVSKLHYRCLSGLNLWNEDLTLSTKKKVESYWKIKLSNGSFNETEHSKEKYYVLSMFPYPSGSLHMGHVRVYTISDTIARYQRMNGKNVLHPIGWDAFGLPAENAAIDRQIGPSKWTNENIAYMKRQLLQLGCSFDWNREITTCQPEYYKWTQELFLKLFDNDLVYQKEALVNWDPEDQTVLADEQVDENGCSWRSGAKVEQRLLKQWFIKTTKYAKDLVDGLDDPILQDWRDIIKIQKHWIGECNGVHFQFLINDQRNKPETISLWTSKPEYIKYAKFIAISNDHIMAKKNGIGVKGGSKALGLTVRNPFTQEDIPVFVTDEISFLPFTDSYIGIPGVLEESTNFAVNLDILYTIPPLIDGPTNIAKCQSEIIKEAKLLNVGGYWSSAKLKDWLISRQRYWGTPIPIIHCYKCGSLPVPRNELPVTLPIVTSLVKKGSSQLKSNTKWINTICPKCGGSAKRETDTMDTFFDSSWYFLRYLDSKMSDQMFDVDKAKIFTPVDLYIGGKEHAVLHLYYARFVSHFLYSLDLLPDREPFKRLLVQGMVMGRSYRIKNTGKYVHPSEVKFVDSKKNKAVLETTGDPVITSWEKMSKSKLNGVDPKDMFEQYSTDTTRLLILADVAPTSHRNWNSNTFPGIISWQKRLWLTIQDFLKHRKNTPVPINEGEFKTQEDYMFDSRNFYIKGTTFNYFIAQQLSVAISKQQGLTNSIRRAPPYVFAKSLQFERALGTQLILLSPMAPHFASELWTGYTSAPGRLNKSDEINWNIPVLDQKWPETDFNYKLKLVCKVNSQEYASIKITRRELEKLSKDEALELALKESKISDVLGNRLVSKCLYDVNPGLDSVIDIWTSKPNFELLEATI